MCFLLHLKSLNLWNKGTDALSWRGIHRGDTTWTGKDVFSWRAHTHIHNPPSFHGCPLSFPDPLVDLWNEGKDILKWRGGGTQGDAQGDTPWNTGKDVFSWRAQTFTQHPFISCVPPHFTTLSLLSGSRERRIQLKSTRIYTKPLRFICVPLHFMWVPPHFKTR